MLKARNLSTASSTRRKRSMLLGASRANSKINLNELMKSLKYLFTIAVLTGALAVSAKANIITNLGEFATPNQNPGSITAVANANGGDSGVLPDDMDLVNAGRITGSSGGSLTNSFGTFSVTTDASNNAFLTFTLNPGFVLAAVAIHAGGGQTDRLFAINDETSGVNEGPFFGHIKNGMNQGLSNFDIFVEEGGRVVPDGGTTAMLLGGALGCLGLVRRYLKH